MVNFGVLYGMSQHGLAVANMTYPEAQHFINEYYRMRPKLKQYMEATIQKAHDDGFVETIFGRRRWTPDVKSSNFAVPSSSGARRRQHADSGQPQPIHEARHDSRAAAARPRFSCSEANFANLTTAFLLSVRVKSLRKSPSFWLIRWKMFIQRWAFA